MDIPEIVTDSTTEFDWSAWGLTDLQVGYCRARSRGLNRTQSAIQAGYGNGADASSGTLRSTASTVEKSPRVVAALNAWRVWNGQKSEAPLDDVEVDKELARIARSATSETARLQALKFVSERQELRREARERVMVTADIIRERLGDVIGQAACNRLIVHFALDQHPIGMEAE